MIKILALMRETKDEAGAGGMGLKDVFISHLIKVRCYLLIGTKQIGCL